MKKLLFFACFFASAGALSAQDYIPLVQEQATWIIKFSFYGEPDTPPELFGYRIEGDTLLDGTAYKKVYLLSFFTYPDSLPVPPYRKSGQALFGAIREDLVERKVYARIFERKDLEDFCTDVTEEKLWYDFSAEIGDTLPSCLNDLAGGQNTVTGIDTIFLYGENRRNWAINQCIGSMVEGIGTQTGLFDPFFCLLILDAEYKLIDYCVGSELNCGIVDASATREELLPASALKVFPNPAADQFRVVLDVPAVGIESVSLYNVSGALLVEVPGNGSSALDLDMRRAPPGVYLIRVITTKGLVVSKVILQNGH